MNGLGILGKENWSPVRPSKSNGKEFVFFKRSSTDFSMSIFLESGFVANSPFGLLASPLSNIDLMSPESTMSFSLSSPPPNNTLKSSDIHSAKDMLSANISPSIFSPDDHHHGAIRFLSRDKEHSFAGLHLFDETNRMSIFPKEVSLEKKVQKKSLRSSKIKRELESEKEELFSNSEAEVDTLHTSANKSRRLSASKATPTPETSFEDVSNNPSPHHDLARRLSLESNSEPVVRSLRLASESSKCVTAAATAISAPVLHITQAAAKKTVTSSAQKSTPTRTTCNCKKSRCLKLYCDCFAVLKYCDSTYCNCVQCYNNIDNEDKRSDAIKSTREKNLLAFQTKISDKDQHVTGCHCKNSHCLKKYCECFTGGALCGVNCKCQSCKNYEGSADLLKTREASPKAEGTGKKRKESPNGVDWINDNSPQMMKLETSTEPERKTTPYAFRSRTKDTQKTYHYSGSFVSESSTAKRRKVKFATTPYIYPFFGQVHAPKIVALKCLDFLSNKDIYTMSQVSSIWNQVAMDEALWE